MTDRTLAQLVDGAPLVVCLGPGGVGKTTLAAVLALHQAATGKRALVLTIDPARRLADALGIGSLTNDPAPVASFSGLHPDGTLNALMLDPTATFDHMIDLLVGDPERRRALLENRFYQHMSRSLAGTLEYMAVERLHELHRSGAFDRIVLDTPPTTNALDFLEAPDRLADFFSEKVTRWFLPGAKERSQSWTSRLFSRAGATAMSLLSRVAGEGFVEETMSFFAAFSDLLVHFRSRGVEIGKLLRDPKTVFLVVCSPDLNRIEEAKAIDRKLAQAGCTAHAFVVNRVESVSVPGARELEEAVAKAAEPLGGEEARERIGTFLARLEAHRQARESAVAGHGRAVEALREHARGRPVYTAPLLRAGLSPRASLLALHEGLFPADPAAAAQPAPAGLS